MIRHAAVLLGVWREACRHIEIGESVERIAPILARKLPAHLLLIRQLDPRAKRVDTIAVGRCRSGRLPQRNRIEVSEAELRALLEWRDRREVIHLGQGERDAAPPGLLPADLDDEVIAGPLEAHGGAVGFLIFAARRSGSFHEEHVDLAAALLDPFSAALENDHRLRELRSLREAVEAENRTLLSKLGRHDISDSIIGAETGLKPVMEQVEKVSRSDAPVLILGETGSGKEVVARAIHARSRRSAGPFLRVNCGAIPPDLVDSELFGHEKGSFTGAVGERRGWFERADGGTLFLDECGELPPAAQVRLLRVLQDGVVERVGGERPMRLDVRIVAATHRDLEAMVADGRFRQDLWYRIAVFPIRLPSLRERPADIPAMAAHFAIRAAGRLGMPPLAPSPEDISLLVSYRWPGNVRELAAVVERAAILGNGERLDVAGALGMPGRAARGPKPPAPHGSPIAGRDDDEAATLDATMKSHIEDVLARTLGRVEGPFGAATILNINPQTLRSRMKKLGIDWRSFRAPA